MAALPLLTRNWPLKLAALALAVLLWVFVAAEETTSQLVAVQVDLEYRGPITSADALLAELRSEVG